MILRKKRKLLFLSGLLLNLFIISFIIPISMGDYGSDFATAQTIPSDGYELTDTLLDSDNYAYYKTYCGLGKELYVQLECEFLGDINLRIYSPALTLLDYSNQSGTFDSCYVSCDTAGNYYICLIRHEQTGNLSFTLKVSKFNVFPGFDIIITAFSIIALFGIIIMVKIRKSEKKNTLIYY
ncbi:MAG: hypothetical protein ACTSPY_06475 [Candidatus Helarchaeota archaeon]